jgi:hypothetical protein
MFEVSGTSAPQGATMAFGAESSSAPTRSGDPGDADLVSGHAAQCGPLQEGHPRLSCKSAARSLQSRFSATRGLAVAGRPVRTDWPTGDPNAAISIT